MARQGIAIVLSDSSDIDWTDRQVELLDAALALLVALGRAPTMTEVAREASCSKETLYPVSYTHLTLPTTPYV